MSEDETRLEMAQRHVAQGTSFVSRQQEIVDAMRIAQRRPLALAERLLQTYHDLQRQHVEYLTRIST